MGRRDPCISRPRRPAGTVRLLAAALAMVALSGCVYYNTFYLARKYYRLAVEEEKKNTTGKLAPAAKTNFDKSIQQCSKVLQRHAGSSWADDAFLLMGQAYYGSQQYAQARRWLGELETSHPTSKLVPEARYWIARSYLAEGSYDRARAGLAEVLQAFPDYERSDEIAFDLAETEFRDGRFLEAAEKYQAFLDRYPKSPHHVEAILRIGDSRLERRQYGEALESFQTAVLRARDPKTRLEARIKLGRVLEQEGKHAEALESYQNLAFELLARDKLNQLMTGADQPNAANVSRARGAEQQLETRYNPETGVTSTLNPLINRDADGNMVRSGSEAEESAEEGEDPRDQTAGGASATAPRDNTIPLDGTTASRQVAAAAVQANPLAAELPRVLLRQGLCLSQLGDDKQAIAVFRAILAAWPRTSEAAEAQFRIGYIQEVNLEDYVAARKSYDAVSQQGPSIFADQAKRRSSGVARLAESAAAGGADQPDGAGGKGAGGKGAGAGAAKKAPVSEAEKEFLAAELYYFQQDKPARALEQYARVESLYADSRFAPKAALARAWILLNAMNDSAGGNAAYQRVLDAYPRTEESGLAWMVLKGEPPPPEMLPVVADSAAAPAAPDSAAAPAAGAEGSLAAGPEGAPAADREGPAPGPAGAPTAPGDTTSAGAEVAERLQPAGALPPGIEEQAPRSRLAPADSKGLPRPVAARPEWGGVKPPAARPAPPPGPSRALPGKPGMSRSAPADSTSRPIAIPGRPAASPGGGRKSGGSGS